MLLGILLTLLIVVCVCLVVVILLQRSDGGALGMGGGSGSLLTTRGTGDLLTKTTQILGGIFFILCLTITFLTGRVKSTDSLNDIAPVGKLNPAAAQRPALPSPVPSSGGFDAPAPSLGSPAAPSTDPLAPSPVTPPAR
ncbi:hypothetical protein BH11PSE2_BH11PSE2_01990 [soil metagenome]